MFWVGSKKDKAPGGEGTALPACGAEDQTTSPPSSPPASTIVSGGGDEENGGGVHGGETRAVNASALTGGSGVSLDGESLVIPPDNIQGSAEDGYDYGDDVSSINTSLHDYHGGGGGGQMKILGVMDHEDEVPHAQNTYSMSRSDDDDDADTYGYDELPRNKSAQAIATSGMYEHKTPSYTRSSGRALGSSRGGGGGSRTSGSRTSQSRGTSQSKKSSSHNSYPKKSFSQDSDDDEDRGCLPLWIVDAPSWLKLVIIMSTALLVGAIVLIGVGAALAMNNSDDSVDQQTLQQQNPGDGGSPPTLGFAPTLAPVTIITSPPADAPTTPSGSDGGDMPTGSPPTEPPVSSPTTPDEEEDGDGDGNEVAAPTDPPQVVSPPTEVPVGDTAAPTTGAPMKAPTTPEPMDTMVQFFVTGGRFTGDALESLPGQLQTLPNIDGDTVLFHLGDWNSPYATSCVESSYTDNVELYQNSAVPVYFVPGDNEFNDCPNPTQAFGFWYEYILGFESKYWDPPTAYNISRQEPNYSENFAFVQKDLLMLSINLVGGVVHNSREWEDRHAADLDWIDEQYTKHQGQYSVMVILAHADPDIQANADFFDIFYQRVEQEYTDIQIIYIHRNLGVESWALEPSFNGISNLMVVVVEGSVWPPMLVQLDTSAGIFEIDQQQWYIDYLDTGSV